MGKCCATAFRWTLTTQLSNGRTTAAFRSTLQGELLSTWSMATRCAKSPKKSSSRHVGPSRSLVSGALTIVQLFLAVQHRNMSHTRGHGHVHHSDDGHRAPDVEQEKAMCHNVRVRMHQQHGIAHDQKDANFCGTEYAL